MASVVLRRDREFSDLPLVLLAPFPLDARVWTRLLDRLDGDVITVEPPGFGGTPAEGPPSLDAYADAVVQALADIGVERFVVAGNSMGGYTAMALAERHPQRVAGIGLLGTKSTADTPEARDTRLQMADKADEGASASDLVGPMREKLMSATTRADDVEAVTLLDDWLAQAPTAGIAWAQRAMSARPDRTDILRVLGEQGIPGLVVHGSDDPLMGADVQEPMAQALRCPVTTVRDRGHLLGFEAPDATAAALADLWTRAQATTDPSPS